ncbi:hypothetical protein AGABI2DRAFT_138804 [Agaricus bisporus var. bisporus H97]|uniref:hypothetical protein n=1 Tax=Agaricus bisporus var. bisporus (strain H97 / ATCC MYA-4626 / FGSC 10389) TaxID=936046 RepID=UPI00029F53D3|nr:hypothetical protein AGABI2DRAFT_138804 [Agaricus bisporus var. bisporus H97]EKV43638.1 hypothetical protein AGABI2DRAFT_138804 [Agaricus bisporus var. bisporus H97]
MEEPSIRDFSYSDFPNGINSGFDRENNYGAGYGYGNESMGAAQSSGPPDNWYHKSQYTSFAAYGNKNFGYEQGGARATRVDQDQGKYGYSYGSGNRSQSEPSAVSQSGSSRSNGGN